MALTFGTLLSSQGADAHVPRPIAWPFFVAVIPLYTKFRSSRISGIQSGGFPGLATRSVLAWCMQNDTRPQRASAGGSPGRSCADRAARLSSGNAAQATPRGRNWTLTLGPTALVVLGMQCSHVR